MAVQHLKQFGKVKKLVSECLMNWPKIKKTVILRCHIFSYSTQQQWTISRSDCDVRGKVDFIQQPVMTSSAAGHTSQSQNLHQKNIMVTEGLLPVWPTHYSFLNPGETTASEKWGSNRWYVLKTAMPAAGIGQQNESNSPPQCPTTCHTAKSQKLNESGYKVLPHPPHSSWRTTISDYNFFKHLDNFLQGKTLPQPAGGRKWFLRVHQISKQGFLCYSNKQTHLSLAKMCWL